MDRLAVVSWLVVVGISSGHAEEINTRKLTLAGVSDCLAEAIATNSAVDDGSVNTAHHWSNRAFAITDSFRAGVTNGTQ
jgi:hypothetical protein